MSDYSEELKTKAGFKYTGWGPSI